MGSPSSILFTVADPNLSGTSRIMDIELDSFDTFSENSIDLTIPPVVPQPFKKHKPMI